MSWSKSTSERPSALEGLFFRATSLAGHSLRRKNRFQVHSPFVHRFYEAVLRGRDLPPPEIVSTWQTACASSETVAYTDLGAGPKGGGGGEVVRSVGEIARRSSRNPKEGAFLMRLARFVQPQTILELGTNLGFSGLYLHAGAPSAELITVEGGQALAAIAKRHFAESGLKATIMQTDFDLALDHLATLQQAQPDLVLMDGNHRKAPTLRYFHRLLPVLPEGGCMVFDDIYWSPEMAAAWNEVRAHPEVTVSIDLWRMGVCFIRRNQAKEHFSLAFRG